MLVLHRSFPQLVMAYDQFDGTHMIREFLGVRQRLYVAGAAPTYVLRKPSSLVV